MKLQSVTLSNFRCYNAAMEVKFDELTTLVGRNDAGKSSILDALDMFFNDRAPDKNDASKGGNAKSVTISCRFSDFPAELLLDEAATTSLASEYLLAADGTICITKTYNCSIEKPKLSSLKLTAVYPRVESARDLLSLKIDELKARAAALGVDLNGVNKTVKRELRSAIREKIGALHLEESDVVLLGDSIDDKANTAKVWEGLKAALPLFALFKSDRQSSDQDGEAQDPLKAAIKEAIAAQGQILQGVMERVETEVRKVADLTLQKLREMDESVADTLVAKFEKPNWASLIKASISGDDDIPLNKRGSGVRRLVLLNFFRAKAEKALLDKSAFSTIYAVEEPETSQHPHNQRMLIRALEQLANGTDQVIITTHTPALARALPGSSLRFVKKNDDSSRTILTGGTDDINKLIADSLGVLPDNSVKAFIVVEGIHDIAFLKSLASMYKSHGVTVPDLHSLELSGEVIFVPAGGANNLAYWTSKLHNLNRPEFHLYDRDVPSANIPKHQARVDEVNLRANCMAFSTSRLEMENFVHHEAINSSAQALGLPCKLASAYGPDDDVPKLLAAELNQHAPAHARWGENKVKAWLAAHVVPAMTVGMVAQMDAAGEMKGWMDRIGEMIQ
jgi:putative ATP-dependent endonuclease of the OLD family